MQNGVLHIIHVIWSPATGGIQRLLLNLLDEQLQDPELLPEVLCGKKQGDLLQEFEKKVKVYQAELNSGIIENLKKYNWIKELFSKADIIHIHSFNPILALAAQNSGAKIIYTEHGNFGFGKSRSIKTKLIRWMMNRFLNNHISYISFNSSFTKKTATALYGLQEVKSQVIPNGIPLEKKELTETPDADIIKVTSGKFVIGTVARLAGVKRIDRLISGFAKLKGRQQAVLLIIGDGSMESELKLQVDQLGITDLVYFAGSRNPVSLYYSLMDVCVLSSQNEAFGLVAIEAYLAGKPVLVFRDGGGVTEIVNNFEPEMVAGNEDEFAAILDRKMAGTKENDENAERRIAYAKTFDIRRVSAAFKSIYITS